MGAVHYHAGRFPPENLDWRALVPSIGPAVEAVARYDGMLAAIPNPDVLLAPLATREAVLSSRIEGTQATMDEVLGFEAGRDAAAPERRDDIQEVLNYRAAMRLAEKMLEDLPLSQRVIREAHRVLLSSARGANAAPGEYRRTPNWIGPPGCGPEDARFVPVEAHKLADAMSAWERFMHDDAPDRLVQLAILHAEFEALHPFLDGNGRMGRLLVPLFLWRHKIIARPVFYVSAYLEANRDSYYDGLLAVSRDNDWTGWCRFFLEAVRLQAEENLEKTKAIRDLYEDMMRRIPDITRSRYAVKAVDLIFQRTVVSGVAFTTEAGIPASTARRILDVLSEKGVLEAVVPGRGRRTAIFVFPELFDIVELGGAA